MQQDKGRVHRQGNDVQPVQSGRILVGILLGVVDQSPEGNLVQGIHPPGSGAGDKGRFHESPVVPRGARVGEVGDGQQSLPGPPDDSCENEAEQDACQ